MLALAHHATAMDVPSRRLLWPLSSLRVRQGADASNKGFWVPAGWLVSLPEGLTVHQVVCLNKHARPTCLAGAAVYVLEEKATFSWEQAGVVENQRHF